jgi:hypothetical protein
LCESPTLFNSSLQAIWDDAIVVRGHENHVIARLGISTLTHHQVFIGTVISKDLGEIAVSVDLVKRAAKVARLPGTFLILNFDAQALKLLLVVAK